MTTGTRSAGPDDPLDSAGGSAGLIERSSAPTLSHRGGRLGLAAGQLQIRGDDSGGTTTLVYLGERRIGLFDNWDELRTTLESEGLLGLDPAGCRFLLAYGLVPPPHSLYDRVRVLGVGDRLRIGSQPSEDGLEVDFPFDEARSRQDGKFDLSELRGRMAAAVSRATPPGQPAVLMQSAGKDSTGLLVALAAAGRTEVRALTYDSHFREREATEARALARRFGLRHLAVDADPKAEMATLLGFLERAPTICADVALIPYLHVLERAEVEGGVVLDGLGNDAYMGYVQPRTERWLTRLSIPRWLPALWGAAEPPAFDDRLAYLWKSVLMYPTERMLAGSRLAPKTVRQLLPGRSAFDRYFADVERDLRGRSPIDRRAFVRGRIFDGCETMLKGRIAAAQCGAQVAFPYCDAELIDYCFHLPRSERYDAASGANKLALRKVLDAEVGASPYLKRKGSFRFDVRRFVEENEATVRRELRGAERFFTGLRPRADWLMARRSGYVHAYALLTLFMLCAWLNRGSGTFFEKQT